MEKYLATDLDGTLLYPKSHETYVCKENTEVIKKLNNRAIIISGRNPQFICGICDELQIPHTFVACNGAIIYKDGKPIFTSKIKGKNILNILNYVETNFSDYYIIFFNQNGLLYSIFDNEKIANEREERAFTNYPKLSYKTNKNRDEILSLINNNQMVKVNLVLKKDNQKELLSYIENNFPKFSIAVCSNSVEITNNRVNKGESLQRLTKKLKLNNDDVYVIGDDGNDLSMFNLFSNSFLVKNEKNKFLENKVKFVLNKFSEAQNYMEE